MTINYQEKDYITDNDLEVTNLGFWPRVDIKNLKLKKIFQEKFGRDFLGGDELIAYSQSLVSRGVNFDELALKILEDVKKSNYETKKKVFQEKFGRLPLNDKELGDLEKEVLEDIKKSGYSFKEILFNKTATGIGRGHSLGGLAGVVLEVHGTKMIDSGLTGLCSSRSLVTSSRRRETGTGEIAIPESLKNHPLLREYMQISEDVFKLSDEFKKKFGKSGGIETFNKVIPYNSPADLFIVLPLDTLATITTEVNTDRLNPNGNFVPRELHLLSGIFQRITKEAGQNIMYNQRIKVPRDTHLHYTFFTDPSESNYAFERGMMEKMDINPHIINVHKDFTPGFLRGLRNLKQMNQEIMKITDPKKLYEQSMKYVYALRNFCNQYNEAVRVKIADTLSKRVHSEQKRHATLRQNVESVYSGAERAYDRIFSLWDVIESACQRNNLNRLNKIIPDIEENIVIDDNLKNKPEILMPYVYHSARQLMLYGEMIKNGFEPRDALYIAPKNIRLRTLENYDLINLINLELPLRLCSTCEPERNATSWKKRGVIAEAIPELEYFLQPKCRVGFCTEKFSQERGFCGRILQMRKYDEELHNQTKQYMLSLARESLL